MGDLPPRLPRSGFHPGPLPLLHLRSEDPKVEQIHADEIDEETLLYFYHLAYA